MPPRSVKLFFTVQVGNIRWTWWEDTVHSGLVSTSSASSTATSPVASDHHAGVPTTPVLFILASCVSLQFGAALAIQLFPAIGSWGATALRLGFAALVLLVVVRPRIRTLSRQQWLAIIPFGLAIGLMNGTFYASIARIPLGTAVAIEFLGPLVLAAVLSTRRTDLLWVLLALAGVGMFGLESFLGAASLDLVGVLLALVAGAFWAGYVLTSARVGRLVAGQDGLALAMVIGTLVVLPAGAPGALAGLLDPHLLLLALGTAVLSSVLPYSLELTALRRLPRHVFGILLSLEPVVALIAGALLVGQDATPAKIAAAALVVIASAGVTLTARRGDPAQPQPADEAPGWELPTPTHATLTGEMPIVLADEAVFDEPDTEDGGTPR